jgi:Outer membrane protein beta-barrel domain
MKRLVLLFLLPIFLFPTLNAQKINFGAKAGFQSTNFTHTTDSKPAILYHFGGFGTASLMDRLQGQGELNLSFAGSDRESKDHYKQRNLYLTVPLLAKYRVYDRLSVQTGIQFGFLLSAKLKITEGELADTYDRKDRYSKTEVAFLAGAEYAITKRLSAGIRVNRALTKLAVDYEKTRHNAFQVFAAYTLNERDF